MTPTNGIMCVPCSSMILSTSSTLLNYPALSTSSIVMVVKVGKHKLIVMWLVASEENFSIKLTFELCWRLSL